MTNKVIELIQNYGKIYSYTTGKLEPIILDEQDLELLQAYANNNKVLTKKTRQIGFTTLTLYYLAVEALLTEKKIVLVSNKLESSMRLLSTVKEQIEILLSDIEFVEEIERISGKQIDLLSVLNINNKREFSFKHNNSHFRAISGNPHSFCGFTFDRLFMDEFDFIENFDEIYRSIQPASNQFSKLFLGSTINTKNRNLHNLRELYNDVYGFHKISLDWWKCSRYNKDLIWVKDGLVVDGYPTESYKDLIKLGYKPSNDWYQAIVKNYGCLTESIKTEVDNQFPSKKDLVQTKLDEIIKAVKKIESLEKELTLAKEKLNHLVNNQK